MSTPDQFMEDTAESPSLTPPSDSDPAPSVAGEFLSIIAPNGLPDVSRELTRLPHSIYFGGGVIQPTALLTDENDPNEQEYPDNNHNRHQTGDGKEGNFVDTETEESIADDVDAGLGGDGGVTSLDLGSQQGGENLGWFSNSSSNSYGY